VRLLRSRQPPGLEQATSLALAVSAAVVPCELGSTSAEA